MSLRLMQRGAQCKKQVTLSTLPFIAIHGEQMQMVSAGQLKTQENVMSETPKVKGPASYFPSIEKTYGQPIAHWMGILTQAGELKHMELVSLLRTQHKLGHGHANALVAHFFGQKE